MVKTIITKAIIEVEISEPCDKNYNSVQELYNDLNSKFAKLGLKILTISKVTFDLDEIDDGPGFVASTPNKDIKLTPEEGKKFLKILNDKSKEGNCIE